MTAARRKAATVAALGLAPLALTGLAAAPAAAHGSMTDPVSRVSACYAENPENPVSAACKAAVAASGAQAFYDWNAVNIANAAGNHKSLIPDGKLCSAGNDKYKGLDLPRADWPSSKLSSGKHTFHYKGTAPHAGSFALYVTKDSYDPSKPLKWSDLEAKPFVEVDNPTMRGGDYVFDGVIPKKSGRHLIYSVWQRSDSPEAFYTCSDVVFGKDTGGSGAGTGTGTDTGKGAGAGTGKGTGAGTAPAPVASAPTDKEIAAGASKSTVEHKGHGDNDHRTGAGVRTAAPQPQTPAAENKTPAAAGNAPAAQGGAPAPAAAPAGENLAETGGDSSTPYIAVGGAAVLALGAAVMFGSVRRKAAAGGRHGR